MKTICLMMLVLIFLASFGCGPASRGEECSTNSHRLIDCAEGLECVSKGGKEICVAPKPPPKPCETDKECKQEDHFCFGNVCATERDEDQWCVEDRQCKGELVCSSHKNGFEYINVCLTEEKADALAQCFDTCLNDYYESCLAECPGAGGAGEAGCNEVCELVLAKKGNQKEYAATKHCSAECQ